MSNVNLISELNQFDDEKLQDILRNFGFPCSGRRHLLISRLASAIKRGKIPGLQLPSVMASRSESDESLAVGNADFAMPPITSEESDFDLPEGFAPLHMREEVSNLIDNALEKVVPEKQLPDSLNGAIPKNSRTSQQFRPGYFPVLPLPDDQVVASNNRNLNGSFQAAGDNFSQSKVLNASFQASGNCVSNNVTANNLSHNPSNFQTNSNNNFNSQAVVNNNQSFQASNMQSQNLFNNNSRPSNNRQSGNFNRQNVAAPRNQDNSYAKTIEAMHRWNLKFSGTKAEDPENFLTRLNEGRAIVTISNNDFLKCLPFFLEGIALHWFRNEQANWQTLADFVQAFRARFGPIDYQNALFFEIRNRTQGPSEPVSDFITCMKSLMARSVPAIPLAQQIEIVSRNLLPVIQNGIDTSAVFDLSDLERLARHKERRFAIFKEYKPPPPPLQALHVDFAYRDPKT